MALRTPATPRNDLDAHSPNTHTAFHVNHKCLFHMIDCGGVLSFSGCEISCRNDHMLYRLFYDALEPFKISQVSGVVGSGYPHLALKGQGKNKEHISQHQSVLRA
jgi:hypothetical protein